MPIRSGKYAGSQNVAKAAFNLVSKSPTIAAGTTYSTEQLDCPGLPILTWIVSQTAGPGALTVTRQVALRRLNPIGVQPAALEWMNVSPPTLIAVGGTPTVFQFNIAAEAMRMQITAPGGTTGVATTILSASG